MGRSEKINNPQGRGVWALQNMVGYGGSTKKRLGGCGCGAGKENPQEGGVPWWLKNEGSGVWHGKNSPTWAVKWQVYDKIQDR